jgi:BirA family transcriptional regulator, biotin operon repressor / biotin---[acetyl-CoA-carboxylase] ligase
VSRAPGDGPVLGLPRVHHRVTDSTSERAKALAEGSAPHGTLVTADAQTAGRGRQGRRWEAAPGTALLASLVLRGLDERAALLPLAAALAVCEACEASAPVRCAIKWPNDVWVDRGKVAGILVEGRPQEGWTVLGIGVNVASPPGGFPGALAGSAASLELEPGARATVLATLLDALGRRLEDQPDRVLEAWRGRDVLLGQTVSYHGGEGTAAGIDQEGALLVDTAEGRVALDAGEVHLGPTAGSGG